MSLLNGMFWDDFTLKIVVREKCVTMDILQVEEVSFILIKIDSWYHN